MKLTEEALEALFNCNAPNAKQIATMKKYLGLKSFKRGWMKRIVGSDISDALYAELLDSKGRRPAGWPKKEWKKPCTPSC